MSIQTRVRRSIYNLLPTDISGKTWHSSCSEEGDSQETAQLVMFEAVRESAMHSMRGSARRLGEASMEMNVNSIFALCFKESGRYYACKTVERVSR
jgi:hypothetical protein